MRHLRKSLFGLSAIGIALGVSALAHAANAPEPYYPLPAWDLTLPATTRFIVLTNMGSQAVLDRETGVVWERSPDVTPPPGLTQTWGDAHVTCNIKTIGNRKGWRLPTVHELASLIDPNNPAGNPDLPPGHPFTNVQSGIYWSATSDAAFATHAWTVNFFFSNFAGGPETQVKTNENLVWCARGGVGADPK
jgi:hypothetical protein